MFSVFYWSGGTHAARRARPAGFAPGEAPSSVSPSGAAEDRIIALVVVPARSVPAVTFLRLIVKEVLIARPNSVVLTRAFVQGDRHDERCFSAPRTDQDSRGFLSGALSRKQVREKTGLLSPTLSLRIACRGDPCWPRGWDRVYARPLVLSVGVIAVFLASRRFVYIAVCVLLCATSQVRSHGKWQRRSTRPRARRIEAARAPSRARARARPPAFPPAGPVDRPTERRPAGRSAR